MMKFRLLAYVFLLACLAFQSSDLVLLQHPDYWPKPVYDFKNNPLSRSKIYLGRVLFYDPILSRDSSVSCASCHSPYNAFAHTDHNLSHGINDAIGTRNAPALMNLAWHKLFMWDGAVNHIDVQALAPISHPKEMGEDIAQVVNKLQRLEKYRTLFKAAFCDTLVTGERILKAMAQFQLTLLSCTSKYDSVKQGMAKFSEIEQRGYKLFKKHCNGCHTEPLFSNYAFASNGLPPDSLLDDKGRAAITHKHSDSLLFKVPTLRNIEYSYPYMHDGRFKNLNQALNHYASGIKKGSLLSKPLSGPVPLNGNNKVELTAFLLTLSDKSFVFNKEFGFPKEFFKK